MSVPQNLRSVISETLKAIAGDPNHEFGPSNRMKFVERWCSLGIPEGDLAYRFLDVLSAEKVIPIYEAQPKLDWADNWYHSEMAKRLIQIAKAVLVDEIPHSIGSNLATSHHYTIGNMDGVLPCNGYMALIAANTALLACSKQQPPSADFEVLSIVSTVGIYEVGTQKDEMGENLAEPVTGHHFTDLNWAKHGSSDTASAAAIAWSCDEESCAPDSNKLLEFWAWWFNVAIPEAWQMAGYIA